jgi:pilus assembly protein CpaB
MSARQLVVLAVALVAAIGALLVIRGMSQAREEKAPDTPIAGEMVLVAAKDVPQGAALASGDLAWRLFPQESVTEAFVKKAAQPEALSEMLGGVTRRVFIAGEPITLGSIVLPDGHGFMAAQLLPGYRAISIEIETEDAAGGFIQPNDRVDVLGTVRSEGGEGERDARTTTLLQDVRVLALDETTQPQTEGEAPTRVSAKMAVLELSEADARLLTSAAAASRISLVLRGVEAETAGMRAPSAAPPDALSGGAGGITLHVFGKAGRAS